MYLRRIQIIQCHAVRMLNDFDHMSIQRPWASFWGTIKLFLLRDAVMHQKTLHFVSAQLGEKQKNKNHSTSSVIQTLFTL